jgi:septal ring factor EnvC (AmiA/AmiB activator)
MKKFLLQLVLVCLLGVIIYGLFTYKQGYSSDKDKQYQKTIDSLALEISKKDTIISSLDSTRKILDSLIEIDKAKLADIAKKAQQYKDQYEKERDRLNSMSDDDIISQFTTAFK